MPKIVVVKRMFPFKLVQIDKKMVMILFQYRPPEGQRHWSERKGSITISIHYATIEIQSEHYFDNYYKLQIVKSHLLKNFILRPGGTGVLGDGVFCGKLRFM